MALLVLLHVNPLAPLPEKSKLPCLKIKKQQLESQLWNIVNILQIRLCMGDLGNPKQFVLHSQSIYQIWTPLET